MEVIAIIILCYTAYGILESVGSGIRGTFLYHIDHIKEIL